MFRRLLTSSTIALSLLAVAACSAGTSGDNNPGPGSKAKEPDPEPVVSVVAEATPGEKLQLSVEKGEFVSVELTDDDHKEIPADAGTFETTSATADPSATATDGTDSSDADSDTDEADDSAEAGGNLGSNSENDTEETEQAEDTSATNDPSNDPSADPDSTEAPEDGAQGGAADNNPKGTSWESNFTLAGSSSYTWKATTVSPDGNTHESTGTVETAKPKGDGARMRTLLDDDMKVGVGAPIIFNFAHKIPKEYRPGIESRLTVEVTDKDDKPRKVEGAWGWLPDDDGHSRIHYRPKEFWPEHSKIHVSAPVKDVPFSKNSFGAKDMTLDFEIDREQIAVADAKKHRLTVTRSGKKVMDFPASLGAARSPSYNGMHIVMSKSRNYTMKSERWGYSTPVTHAVRIHNNGEFIHAAPWSVGSQGRANVSHGCVNLSTPNATEYYESALFGDPVEVVGSSVSLTTNSGDIKDWVYTWEEWQKLSSIKK
ncbi:Ig-like domain-containing protein [Brevibacterium sp. UMB1308A]|uniref:Ig-like domain-containing protein n=1 Tax=Brevibacterium sp. UMB1308A TaxID=3050608 RepID=UPI00254A4727|nr:Ig-like domain-containing protein [Brevibacterium sp. UMB1308A]MDK8347632.1 Ig-like domain-containing protein [Brevibacterium sp. UMB1308B]MDK8714516.1 Ig-like domain-containing protein [Brevibacterium sp. UMB1308A]